MSRDRSTVTGHKWADRLVLWALIATTAYVCASYFYQWANGI